MARIANEIFDIMDFLNSMKNNQFNIQEIFEMINKNEGVYVDDFMVPELMDFLYDHQFSSSQVKQIKNFDLTKYSFTKKEKRYLN